MPMSINVTNSALLVMDFQNTIISNYFSEDEIEPILANAAELIKTARHANIPVIYVAVGFRPGHPEINSDNRIFAAVKNYGLFIVDEEGTKIHDLVKPQNEEPVIIKNRIGAFSGTELETILRSQKIETLIMAGLTTTGVVLSTVRQAFDLDYRIIIACDCCADPDKQAHDVLIENILTLHADVLTTKAITSSIK
ncbi:cysteine hydrolase family protein [Cedecea neteri]